MKYRSVHILCFLVLCFAFSTTLFAAVKPYFPVHIIIDGIQDKNIELNAVKTVHNYRDNMHVPITQEEVLRFVRKSPHFLEKSLRPFGYFQSQAQTSLVRNKNGWFVTYHVTLGPAVMIRSMHIQIDGEGKTDHKFIHYLQHLPLHVGDRLQTEKYENIKIKLYDLATERGYFNAVMKQHQIKINLDNNTARIIIIFNTGKRFRFGDTTFSQTPFHTSFLKRFLTYQKGHHFNAKKLEKTQTGLVASNYFMQVLIRPEPKKAVNGEVPIKISLILRKRKAYTFGIGYGTDTGLRGTIGYSIRRIGPYGQRFHTLLRASEHDSSYTAKYIIPGPHPANDLFTIGAGASNINQPTGNANNAKFALAYSIFDEHWKNTFSLSYLAERYDLLNSPLFPNTPFISTQLVYPEFDTKYTNTDHITHPSKGISFAMEIMGASEKILSETTFFQVNLHLNTLYTIKKTNTRLLFRSDLGHTDISNLVNLPLSMQLYAGGARSVRGYDYNTIGPGKNLVVASTEVQQKIKGAFYLVGFIDAGVVGDTDIFHHINAGTGPGVAWVSPIGTMELTVAEAFTQQNKPIAIGFTMGSAI